MSVLPTFLFTAIMPMGVTMIHRVLNGPYKHMFYQGDIRVSFQESKKHKGLLIWVQGMELPLPVIRQGVRAGIPWVLYLKK